MKRVDGTGREEITALKIYGYYPQDRATIYKKIKKSTSQNEHGGNTLFFLYYEQIIVHMTYHRLEPNPSSAMKCVAVLLFFLT